MKRSNTHTLPWNPQRAGEHPDRATYQTWATPINPATKAREHYVISMRQLNMLPAQSSKPRRMPPTGAGFSLTSETRSERGTSERGS